MPKNDDNAKTAIKSPQMTPQFIKTLGGMPEKLDADAIMKRNDPGARKAAPDSFRPKGGGNNEKE